MKDYELEIISRERTNKKLKKYRINGNDTVGVYENEPFSVRFKNNTCHKVQVRLSVDGTDVLTGKPAHTDATGQMWVVSPYSDLELKAWPETTRGGAEFLFGKTSDSVAANTHGIMNGQGIIAAAVFVENNQFVFDGGDLIIRTTDVTYPKPILTWETTTCRGMGNTANKFTFSDSSLYCSTQSCDYIDPVIESKPAVGAGGFVDQEITKTAGLYTPVLDKIVQVKYEWWTSLKSKLRKHPVSYNTAFPGDSEKIMSLGATPRKQRNRRRRGSKRISPEKKYKEFNRFMA